MFTDVTMLLNLSSSTISLKYLALPQNRLPPPPQESLEKNVEVAVINFHIDLRRLNPGFS